jgi:hypothetical protein
MKRADKESGHKKSGLGPLSLGVNGWSVHPLPEPGRSEAPPGPLSYFFFDFLAFFAFFAFFAFLAIVSSQGFNGLNATREACSAEGQPRNILEREFTRFAARCRVLSRRCHCVIHRCYEFGCVFRENSSKTATARTMIPLETARRSSNCAT